MDRYRIHIDMAFIPGLSREQAAKYTQHVLDLIRDKLIDQAHITDMEMEKISIRLGNDDDRSQHNHLVQDKNGHSTKAKTVLWEAKSIPAEA